MKESIGASYIANCTRCGEELKPGKGHECVKKPKVCKECQFEGGRHTASCSKYVLIFSPKMTAVKASKKIQRFKVPPFPARDNLPHGYTGIDD